MGIFSWIFLGLIAAAIAKFVMPGKDPGGIIVTILIGIAGAIVGGFLGSFVGLGKVESFDLGGISSGRQVCEVFRDIEFYLSRPGRVCVCRQSRYWFFGQNLGDSPCEISKTQGAVLSVG
jgi:uncharacterized membrane protein YeaQ/YmgE (transglycosylase-associated protein family)